MRITRYATVVVAVVVAVGVGGCDVSPSKAGSRSKEPPRVKDVTFDEGTTMARLNKAQKISIGTKFDQPGFGLRDTDGKMSGFDIQIAEIIATEMGIPVSKIQWKETPSPIREQAIEQGTVDIVVATYPITETRREKVDFAGPYYVAGQQVMVRSDDASIVGPESFKEGSKKICSVINSTPASTIRNYVKDEASQLVLVDVYQKCVDALKAKQVDAVTTDNVILTGFMARNEGQFKLVGRKFTEEPYGIGLKKGDEKLRAFINEVLRQIAQDGRYRKAWKDSAGKYDPSLPTPPPIDH